MLWWHLPSSMQSLKGHGISTSVPFWTSTASAIGAPCDSHNLFIPRGIIHVIFTSVLFWIVLLLVFRFYKHYADDVISRRIVIIHLCRAVHCPVTSHKPSEETGIVEAQPSQQRLMSDFNTAVANKGPRQLLVDRDDWEQRKVAGFYVGRSSLLRCWDPITALGYLQHNFLDDAVDKNLTALGSHSWLRPCRSLRAHLQQQLQSWQCSQANQHLTGTPSRSASRVPPARAQVTTTTGSAQYIQGRQG